RHAARSEPVTRGTGCGKPARPGLWEPRAGNGPGPPSWSSTRDSHRISQAPQIGHSTFEQQGRLQVPIRSREARMVPMQSDKLRAELLALPPNERAELAHVLLESLHDEEPDPGVEVA